MIVINITMCNITGNIQDLGINFLVSQVYKENVSIIYLTHIVLNITTFY